MKIVFECYDTRYSVEDTYENHNAEELKEIFSKILVQAGFPPSVIDSEDGGAYQYVSDDELVAKRERRDEE